MGKFTGRVALVTASTEGIGFAIARRLGQDGAHVVICSRKKANVNKAMATLKSEKISVSGMTCHVGKQSDRKSLLDKIKDEQGGIDILVCNPEINVRTGNLTASSESDYEKVFDGNVKSTFLMIKEAVPLMEGRKNPSVVTVGGYWGLITLDAFTSDLYAVSLAAVMSLSKAFRYSLGEKGIRINSIAPGFITKKVMRPSEPRQRFFDFLPLLRTGVASECAGTVSYLCSDDSSYIAGEVVVVAGGMPSRL